MTQKSILDTSGDIAVNGNQHNKNEHMHSLTKLLAQRAARIDYADSKLEG